MSEVELFDCIKTGDLVRAKRLIREDPSVATAHVGGVSALLMSVYYGTDEIQTEIEAARGEQISLQEAAAVGNLKLLKKRIAENPSGVNDFTNDGYYALGYACFFGHPECVRLLLQNGANVNQHAENPQLVAPIHAAAANGSTDIVRMIIEAGADVNSAQANGFRAIHTAASENNCEIAKLLIEAGADPSITNDLDKTPLDLAIEKGHQEIIELLKG